MTPRILLDRAARDELRRLISHHGRPSRISAVVWHQLCMGQVASLEIRTLAILSDLVGPSLVQELREASNRAAYAEA